jgi:hypothetical protein
MLSAQNYSADDGLNDGKPVIIRSITRTDRAKILTAFEQLDSDSIYSRFFTLKKALSDGDISGLTELGPHCNRISRSWAGHLGAEASHQFGPTRRS